MRLAVEPDGSKFSEPFYVEEPGSKYAKPAYRNFEIRLWKISVSRDPVPGLLRIRGKC